MYTVRSAEAFVKMVELAQQGNSQPRSAKRTTANSTATLPTPIARLVKAIVNMLEMVKKRNLQQR